MPTVADISQKLTTLLHMGVFGDDRRHFETNEPLGEHGVGLDSLGLVQFLSKAEAEFSIEVPTEVWSEADQITIEDFAAVVLQELQRA